MGNTKDITRQRFGRLVVLEKTDKRSGTSVVWKCKCDCGNITYASQSDLHKGATKSCGCINKEQLTKLNESRTKDISGERFGRLTALFPTSKRSGGGSIIWHCKCDCGNEMEVNSNSLVTGFTKSCGCAKSETSMNRAKNWFISDTNMTQVLKNNEAARSDSKTGVRGVALTKNGKYEVRITFQKKKYRLGVFSDLNEAGEAYKKVRKMFYDEFLESHIEIS